MGIERQVVGHQGAVAAQQHPEPLPQHAGDRFAGAPQQAVVHQQGIGAASDCGPAGGQAGGGGGRETGDLCPSLDLQTVGAVIAETLGLE